MAKYDITYKCGHVITEQLFGKMEDRYYCIEKAKEIICPECRKKQINLDAESKRTERGLKTLTGTEKQIAWANTIREGAYKALDCILPYANTEESKKMIDVWKSKMEVQTESKWWIDHRAVMPKSFHSATSESAAATAAKNIIREFISLFK